MENLKTELDAVKCKCFIGNNSLNSIADCWYWRWWFVGQKKKQEVMHPGSLSVRMRLHHISFACSFNLCLVSKPSRGWISAAFICPCWFTWWSDNTTAFLLTERKPQLPQLTIKRTTLTPIILILRTSPAVPPKLLGDPISARLISADLESLLWILMDKKGRFEFTADVNVWDRPSVHFRLTRAATRRPGRFVRAGKDSQKREQRVKWSFCLEFSGKLFVESWNRFVLELMPVDFFN